jgi:hypothetical protein
MIKTGRGSRGGYDITTFKGLYDQVVLVCSLVDEFLEMTVVSNIFRTFHLAVVPVPV